MTLRGFESSWDIHPLDKEGRKVTREGLFSDFLRGIYTGRIVKIYERKLAIAHQNGEYLPTYRVLLPARWAHESYQISDRLIILETATKDLIILHPETVEEIGDALEGILKANKDARIIPGPNVRNSLLWKIYRKYKGAWKVARMFKEGKLPKKKKRDKKEKEKTPPWGGTKNEIGW